MHAKSEHLVAWGKTTGDVFHFVDKPGKVDVWDLRNEAGEVIEAGYFRGSVGGGEFSQPVDAPETPPPVTPPGYYTLHEAVKSIAEQRGWNDPSRDTLLKQFMQAARDGTMTVRHPHTLAPYRPETVRDFYELVTPQDVNEWATDGGVPWRWEVEQFAPQDGAPEPARKAPPPETPAQRRARLLKWHGEAGGGRGALERVFERELAENPKADRSSIGKQVKKAKQEQADLNGAERWQSALIRDGKRPK
ncbi:hypothetical protein [Caenimonas sp. SL110]|uniref:hypothetical protein n=1 Tax=Caenimonas sp. SL110 TaxID=1450524 RepID=UPI00128E1154|nr:hypothetical protein [Caenimonas sp. SL110]